MAGANGQAWPSALALRLGQMGPPLLIAIDYFPVSVQEVCSVELGERERGKKPV